MADHQVSVPSGLYQCKTCERHLPATAFYESNHGCCKECVKSKVRANRAKNIDYYRSYDRQRYRENPDRKELARKCSKSAAGQAARKRHADIIKNTPVRKARIAVGNALRDGKLVKSESCFFCGKTGKLQAHHYDYNRPLDVFWLCPSCHGKLHAVNGDFLKQHKGA